jgi:peptidoglycan hydrolase-like protein with peptidoglycan-binding domain
MLSVLSSYISSIPPVTVDGIYGSATRAAVLAAQQRFRLPETGTVGVQTWDAIYDQYSGIENTTLRSNAQFPAAAQTQSSTRPVANIRPRQGTQTGSRVNYSRTTTLTQFPGNDLTVGNQDPVAQEVVR